MRSSTALIFSAAMISRRSLAIGARSAIIVTASRSASASSASMRASVLTTVIAASGSRSISASIAALICDSHRPPICVTSERSWWISSSNDLTVCAPSSAI